MKSLTTLRRQVLIAMTAEPVTVPDLASALGVDPRNKNSVHRVLSWAAAKGLAHRSVKDKPGQTGNRPWLYSITEAGRHLAEQIQRGAA